MSDANAQKPNTFLIDDREVDIRDGETIFRAARRLDLWLGPGGDEPGPHGAAAFPAGGVVSRAAYGSERTWGNDEEI